MTVFFIQKRRFAFDIHLSLSNWSFLWKMTLFRPIFCRRTRRNTKFVRFSSFLRAKSSFFKKRSKLARQTHFSKMNTFSSTKSRTFLQVLSAWKLEDLAKEAVKIGRKAQNDSFPYPETTIGFWHTFVPVKLVIYLKKWHCVRPVLNMVEETTSVWGWIEALKSEMLIFGSEFRRKR